MDKWTYYMGQEDYHRGIYDRSFPKPRTYKIWLQGWMDALEKDITNGNRESR